VRAFAARVSKIRAPTARRPPRLLGCQLNFNLRLSKPHRPEQTIIDHPVSRQTVVTLVCPNGILSPRTDYAIDRAAVISGAGEPSLNANHDRIVVVPRGVSVVVVRITGVVVVITVRIIAVSIWVSPVRVTPVIGVTRVITAVIWVAAIISSVERNTYSDVPKNAATPRIVSMSIYDDRPAVSCLDNPVFGKRRRR
jgi:hypothetical protein